MFNILLKPIRVQDEPHNPALPLIIPLLTAAAALLAWRSRPAQRLLGVTGAAALLVLAAALLTVVWRHGTQSVQMGGWPAPLSASRSWPTF